MCWVYLKLFERIYAPLTAGLLALFREDRTLAEEKRCELNACISTSVRTWMQSCGGRPQNRCLIRPSANKIPVGAPITGTNSRGNGGRR